MCPREMLDGLAAFAVAKIVGDLRVHSLPWVWPVPLYCSETVSALASFLPTGVHIAKKCVLSLRYSSCLRRICCVNESV